jgi:hypothetical protein
MKKSKKTVGRTKASSVKLERVVRRMPKNKEYTTLADTVKNHKPEDGAIILTPKGVWIKGIPKILKKRVRQSA